MTVTSLAKQEIAQIFEKWLVLLKHLVKNLFSLRGLHEDIGPRVWQSQPHQAATHQHRRGQQDGNRFGDANQRAKDQVAQHGCQLAQGIAEAKAGAPGNDRRRKNTAVKQPKPFVPRWETCTNWPPVCRVQLCGDHVQRVPGRDTEAVVETQHEDHHRLAGSKPEEEAADARQHHGAPCRTQHVNHFTHRVQSYVNINHPAKEVAAAQITSYPACSAALFCPWGGQRQCFQAEQQVFPGSWRSRPSRHCSHRRTSSDSPSCCGGRSCWSLESPWAWSRRYL